MWPVLSIAMVTRFLATMHANDVAQVSSYQNRKCKKQKQADQIFQQNAFLVEKFCTERDLNEARQL